MQARLVATRGTVVIRVVVVSVDFNFVLLKHLRQRGRREYESRGPYVSGEVPVKGEGTVTGARWCPGWNWNVATRASS